MFQSSVELMTPQMAAALLERNTGNRKIRPSKVRYLKNVIARGEWQATHQGVAISTTGRLLDGQHRLVAIVESGVPVEIMVTRGLNSNTFKVIDSAITPRTFADTFNIDKRVADPCSFLAKLHYRAQASTQQFEEFARAFGPIAMRIVDHCGTARRAVGSGPVKAAAVLNIYKRPSLEEFVLDMYRNLVLLHLELLPPIGHAFIRQVLSETNVKRLPIDLFTRAFQVFTADKAQLSRIQIRSAPAILEEARRLISKAIPE